MSDNFWYYAQDNQQQGPISEAELQQLFASNRLSLTTLVWTNHLSNWTQAALLPAFARLQSMQRTAGGTIASGERPPLGTGELSANQLQNIIHQSTQQQHYQQQHGSQQPTQQPYAAQQPASQQPTQQPYAAQQPASQQPTQQPYAAQQPASQQPTQQPYAAQQQYGSAEPSRMEYTAHNPTQPQAQLIDWSSRPGRNKGDIYGVDGSYRPAGNTIADDQPLVAYESQADLLTDEVLKPHPWHRFFARTLDELLFIIVGILPLILISGVMYAAGPKDNAVYKQLVQIVVGAVVLVFVIIIDTILLCTWGTTPGKAAFGIRLRDENGAKLTFAKALARTLWRCLYTGQFLALLPGVAGLGTVGLCCRLSGRLRRKGITDYDERVGIRVEHTRNKPTDKLVEFVR